MPELRNPRREQFCQQYVVDLNQTQAAIRAGYSAKTANVKGSQLMGFPEVAARVAELQAAVAERNEISVDQIASQLDEDRSLAYQQGQASAAVQASTQKGKLGGLFIDRYSEETEGLDPETQIKKLCSGNEFAERSLRLLLSGDVDSFMKIARPAHAPELVKSGVA